MQRALDYAREHGAEFQKALCEFLAIPSISAQPAQAAEVDRCAEWLRARMAAVGLDAGVVRSTGEHPLVVGRTPTVADAPTILVYGHHDVQPVDPLAEWKTPPFEPTEIDGVLYGRGVADDKGPTFASLCAAEAWSKGSGRFPVNLIFLVEGEEECGGLHLPRYIHAHKRELEADALLILDVAGFAPGVPALCYGLRGIVTLEVRVDGPSHDLHSGSYGGAIENPCEVLARLVAGARRPDGSIAIPGVIEGAAEPDAAERTRLSGLPVDEEAFRAETGSPVLFGEPGRGLYERVWSRPTFEVNGIFGGYQGAGEKTIIPAWAAAKLSLRLVPGQEPDRVFEAVRRYFETRAPRTVRVTVTRGHGARAQYFPPSGPWSEMAIRALGDAWRTPPRLVRAGGSIPVVEVFHQELGLSPLLLGTYSPGDRAHSPNERYPLADFRCAIEACVRFFGLAGAR